MTAETVVLRHATAADERALRDLAALDSTPMPAGPFLVAAADGEIRAALSLTDGVAIADPFHRTEQLVTLLRTRAEARAARERRMPAVRRRRARAALTA